MNTTIDSQKAIKAAVTTVEIGFVAAVIMIFVAIIGAGVLLFMIGAG